MRYVGFAQELEARSSDVAAVEGAFRPLEVPRARLVAVNRDAREVQLRESTLFKVHHRVAFAGHIAVADPGKVGRSAIPPGQILVGSEADGGEFAFFLHNRCPGDPLFI